MKIAIFLGILFIVLMGCTTPTENQDILPDPPSTSESNPPLQPEIENAPTQTVPVPDTQGAPETVVIPDPEPEDPLDDCKSDPECTVHSVCANQACHPIEGTGRNSCSKDIDCFDKHLACVDNTCTLIEGRGDNSCLIDSDCGAERKTHLVCTNNACTRVPGPGRDRCWDAWDCNEKHMGCQDNTCIILPGEGSSTCFSDTDCGGEISEEDAR